MAGKPKKKKYPKKPKQSASLSVWQNYEDRVKQIDKDYNAALADYKKKLSLIKKVSSRR